MSATDRLIDVVAASPARKHGGRALLIRPRGRGGWGSGRCNSGSGGCGGSSGVTALRRIRLAVIVFFVRVEAVIVESFFFLCQGPGIFPFGAASGRSGL